jgi:hypothetical protein
MENRNLIGKKIKGFKFESTSTVMFNDRMNDYTKRVGVIESYNRHHDCYSVYFSDFEYWAYPAELIEQHLVDENFIQKGMENNATESSNIKSIQLNGKDIDLKTKRFAETNPLDNLPIIGEGVLMEVSDGEQWFERKICSKTESGLFVAWIEDEEKTLYAWKYCRPITPKTKITRAEFERDFEIID